MKLMSPSSVTHIERRISKDSNVHLCNKYVTRSYVAGFLGPTVDNTVVMKLKITKMRPLKKQ
jgi:hypothetical protein